MTELDEKLTVDRFTTAVADRGVRVPLTVALVALTSPAVAQGDQSIRSTEEQSSPPSSNFPTTDVICREEINATFCNVVGSPSNGGFGSTNNSQRTVGSSAVPSPLPRVGISGLRPNNAIKNA
jgi:hypothetical protein